MSRMPAGSTALPRNTSPSVALAEFERQHLDEWEGTSFNPSPCDLDPDRFGRDHREVKTLPEHSVVVIQLFDRVWIWQCCQCGDTGRARCVDDAVEQAELAGHSSDFWPAVTL